MKDMAEAVKKECLSRWQDGAHLDERLEYFSNEYENWLAQIPEENRETVLILMRHLAYYSHAKTNEWLKELHQRLLSVSNITDDNTVYTFIISPDGQSNSSNDYWTEYKLINSINKNICMVDLGRIHQEDWDQYIENIVFIDDFSGTGNSFITELEKCPERYKNKNVYFLTIDIMKSALDAIDHYAASSEINIYPICAFTHGKAFIEVFPGEEGNSAGVEIYSMSGALRIPEKEIMGFENSQGLVAFYNNTPNNTLGFIRYNTKVYKAIFPRRNDRKPLWQMQDRKRQRRNANYNNKVKGS